MIKNDTLFFAGFIPYIIHEMWKTTMFGRYIHGTREIVFTFICLGLILLKIMLYDHFTVRQLITSALMVLVGALTYRGTGEILYFALMVIVIGAKDVDFDKIISVWLVIIIAIMVMAFAASRLGIIADLQYVSKDFFTKKKIIRNSFGIIYPTDFAAHVFFCVLTLFYLRRDYLKWYDFSAGIITSLVVYYYCRAKLDVLSILLVTLLFGLALIFKEKDIWKKLWSIIGPTVTPITCIVMIALTYMYKPKGSLEWFNRFITGRLFLGKAGITKYSITLFGQKLRLIGNGRSTDSYLNYNPNYNFIDISYINILVVSGVVFLSLLIFIYIIIGYINRKNIFLLCALFMIALNCAIAHHMIEISYNIFTLALFATTGKGYDNQTE